MPHSAHSNAATAPRVFLTGASSGIGASLAKHYAARGAKLGLCARRRSALDALIASLPAGTAVGYAGDVRDADAMGRAGADFIARFGVPDIVIACAGVSVGTLTEKAEDVAVFRTVFDTNVLGMVHTFHPFVGAMRDARNGVLAGIASVAGFRGLPGSGAYSASKAAAITYLETLRLELADSGVTVSTICPGFVATPMTQHNPYRMPFLIDAEKAARLIARAIERKKRFYVLPWPMAIIGRALRAMPRPLYDLAFARAPRKPRGTA